MMAIVFALGMATGGLLLSLVWWMLGERAMRVIDVKPTGPRKHRNLSVRVDIGGEKRLYMGSVTVWHLVTDAGLVRAPTSIEERLADVWETYDQENPDWGSNS